jgi:hypothetical protein
VTASAARRPLTSAPAIEAVYHRRNDEPAQLHIHQPLRAQYRGSDPVFRFPSGVIGEISEKLFTGPARSQAVAPRSGRRAVNRLPFIHPLTCQISFAALEPIVQPYALPFR